MKTDKEIMRILKKENGIFRKLYNALQEIDAQYPRTTADSIIRGGIYEAILLFIDKYRREHPETEKK